MFKEVLGLSIFFLSKYNIIDKGYKVMESFPTDIPFLVLPVDFIALGRCGMVNHASLHDYIKSFLSTFRSEESPIFRTRSTYGVPACQQEIKIRTTAPEEHLCHQLFI